MLLIGAHFRKLAYPRLGYVATCIVRQQNKKAILKITTKRSFVIYLFISSLLIYYVCIYVYSRVDIYVYSERSYPQIQAICAHLFFDEMIDVGFALTSSRDADPFGGL